MATDQSVLSRIRKLSDEAHRLYEKGNLSDEETKRLREINLALDQAWDLLRLRRAQRDSAINPDIQSSRMRPRGG